MKKSFMIFMLSCTFLGAAQADLNTEYETGLDKWQVSYPIIKNLREQSIFQEESGKIIGLLENDSNATPQFVFEKVLDAIWGDFVYDPELIYFYLVEGLDPVIRDLKKIPPLQMVLPTTNGNMYEVKYIFNKPQAEEVN